MLVWNCQGCANPRFDRYLREHAREYSLDLVALLDTRVSKHKADMVVKKSGFKSSRRIEAKGYSGGIWLLWSDSYEVEVVLNHAQLMHIKVW